MQRRALIVGSQTGGLTGVHIDVDAMHQALGALGFVCDVRTGNDATRDGIRDGYRKLAKEAAADDALFVYYSGHGGRAANPDYEAGNGLPAHYQYIVPTDCHAVDFRGIFDFELSLWLDDLTRKTPNVAVALDCCHAARMSRAEGALRLKSLPRLRVEGVEALLAKVRPDLARLHPESNPNAVRLVATEADKPAYEYPRADGSYAGAMTVELVAALAEAKSATVSWHALGMRVREAVLSRIAEQRPEIEGPDRRILFSTEEADRTGAVVYFRRNHVPYLRAGRLLGSAVGAEYAITSYGSTGYLPGQEVATARVVAIEGDVSRIDLTPVGKYADIREGALAFPTKLPFDRRPVSLEGNGATKQVIQAALATSLFVVEAAEQDSPLAKVRCVADTLTVEDPDGLALTDAIPASSEGVAQVMQALTKLARADALRKLGPGDLDAPIYVRWGLVVDHQEQPLDDGDAIHVGDPVFVAIDNQGTVPVFAALFDVGIAGAITLITESEPDGVRIEPGKSYRVGDVAGQLNGIEAGWADGVPTDGPRRQSLVVIASTQRQNFRAFEGARAVKRADGVMSDLDRLLEQFDTGRSRDFKPAPAGYASRYLTREIRLTLNPLPRPYAAGRATFLLDESIDPGLISRDATEVSGTPGAGSPAPSRIAIRFKSLVVHKNRALWSTDIRVDTLVVTAAKGGKSAAEKPYAPSTFQFPKIRDDDYLPFEDLLIYEGGVERYLDIAIWVSKDTGKAKPLSEMLKDAAGNKEFQHAASALGETVTTSATATAAVAVAAAATQIGFVTAKIISAQVGKSIGVYRTSFLPSEKFGAGRHPIEGLIRAQDFSLCYEVIDVTP